MTANDNAPELTDLEERVLRRVAGQDVDVGHDEAAVKAAINRLLHLGLLEIDPEAQR